MKTRDYRRILYVYPQTASQQVNGLTNRIRAVEGFLKQAEEDFDIFVVAPAASDALGPGLRRTLPILPFMRPYISNEVEAELLDKISAGNYSHVIVSTMMLAPYLAAIKQKFPDIAILFDMQDRFSRHVFQDEIKITQLPKQLLRYGLYVAWERMSSLTSDIVFLLSKQDAAFHIQNSKLVYLNNGSSNTHHASVREIVPKPYRLLFVGDFKYKPNVDGLDFLVRKVAPLLSDDFLIDVVGSGVPDNISGIAGASVKIHGYVPDLQPYLEAALVVVVPLFQGSGIKNKVVEGMTAGRVVATTALGNDGVDATDGQELVLFRSAEQLVQRIENVAAENSARLFMEARAREYATERFSSESSTRTLSSALRR